jgi:hypothetical protein
VCVCVCTMNLVNHVFLFDELKLRITIEVYIFKYFVVLIFH